MIDQLNRYIYNKVEVYKFYKHFKHND